MEFTCVQYMVSFSWKIIALKVLANILIMGLLASSAYAVVVVVDRSQEPEADDSWWRQNEVNHEMSLSLYSSVLLRKEYFFLKR